MILRPRTETEIQAAAANWMQINKSRSPAHLAREINIGWRRAAKILEGER